MIDENNPQSSIFERTVRPQQTLNRTMHSQEPQQPQSYAPQQPMYQTQQRQAAGKACPYCGAINDPEAMFCAQCGQPISKATCPHCGAEIDPDADFCEVCHHYIKKDVCSYCGAHLEGSEAYCPECGSPRGGMVCPTCHTLNDFAFCKQCGQPLTDEAQQMIAQLREHPDYQELVLVAREYNELQMQLPYSSDNDMRHDEASLQLRERVLKLLAQDAGVPEAVIPKPRYHRVSKEDLDAQKKQKLEELSKLLDKMAIPATPSPAKVRNYAMAQKPVGVRLAWMCNYKHALHSSPCGCAKPQLGGKWVILGHNSKQEIKDDK